MSSIGLAVPVLLPAAAALVTWLLDQAGLRLGGFAFPAGARPSVGRGLLRVRGAGSGPHRAVADLPAQGRASGRAFRLGSVGGGTCRGRERTGAGRARLGDRRDAADPDPPG